MITYTVEGMDYENVRQLALSALKKEHARQKAECADDMQRNEEERAKAQDDPAYVPAYVPVRWQNKEFPIDNWGGNFPIAKYDIFAFWLKGKRKKEFAIGTSAEAEEFSEGFDTFGYVTWGGQFPHWKAWLEDSHRLYYYYFPPTPIGTSAVYKP